MSTPRIRVPQQELRHITTKEVTAFIRRGQFVIGDSAYIWKDIRAAVIPAMIATTLRQTQGNFSAAAKMIGVNRATLRSWIKKHGIPVDTYSR